MGIHAIQLLGSLFELYQVRALLEGADPGPRLHRNEADPTPAAARVKQYRGSGPEMGKSARMQYSACPGP